MNVHPAAQLFPMMPDAELEALADDIRKNGLNNPIVHDGDVLFDGRNREKACELAGVAPRYQQWDGEGGSPVSFILSQNLARRHLTSGQRAIIANQSRPLYAAEAKASKQAATRRANLMRQEATLPRDYETTYEYKEQGQRRAETAALAAASTGVAPSAVYDAARLGREAPDLLAEVQAGTRSLESGMVDLKKRLEGKPLTVALPVTMRQMQLAEASRHRVERVVGICNALANSDVLKVELAATVATDEEIKGWDASFLEAMSALRKLRERVKEL